MSMPQYQLPLPGHLQHKPVFGVPFFDHDPGREGDTDCQHLSIGWSQWDDKEVSAKVFRHGEQKWSRQSEEIPLARLVDLTSLIVLAVNNRDGNSLAVPANFFENQPTELVIRRHGGSDTEREFYRQSLVDNELLQRRLDKLTDVLLARREAHGTMAYRIPADPEYIQKLGRAVYNFSYYESVVLQSMEKVYPEYLSEYYLAERPYTARKVALDFKNRVSTYPQSDTAAQGQLAAYAQEFYDLTERRNRLIHGHPYTAADGFQQLNYSHSGKPRIEWPLQDVEAAAQEFDDAACRLCGLFDQLWR